MVSWLPPIVPPGLDSVTLTPGSTAPEESIMVPPIAPTPCAIAATDTQQHNSRTTPILPALLINWLIIGHLVRAHGGKIGERSLHPAECLRRSGPPAKASAQMPAR